MLIVFIPDIQREIVDFYKKLYNSDARLRPKMDGVSFRKLSISRGSSLEERFNQVEIRQAVFSLGGDRSPGPDGFPIAFFQQFWDLIEDDLQVFLDEFHDNGDTR